MLKFSATKYSMDKHSALLKFSRFCCEQSAKGFALLEKSAEGYFAEEIVIRNSIAMMKAFLWLL